MLGVRSVSLPDDRVRRLTLAVLVCGVAVRIAFWAVYPPVWKLFPAFTFLELVPVEYLGNFQGYKPTRMPFFDAFTALTYAPLSDVLGVKGLTVFPALLAAGSLPFFYGAAKRLFNKQVALPALVLYAFYPKFVVMAARGLPESASVSFLAIALYGLVRGQDDGDLAWVVGGGVALALSYLMYVPAVGAAVLVVVYSYHYSLGDLGFDIFRDRSIRAILPNRTVVTYAFPATIVGLAYLIWGPIRDLLATASGAERVAPLFVEIYSLPERIIRFVAYVFYDFWWQGRGFDHEGMIQTLLSNISLMFGPVFPLYLLGWGIIAGVLSVLILTGLVRMWRRRGRTDWLVLLWAGGYAGIYLYRNLGWAGAFQTRHIFPIFPALCLGFGVGLVTIVNTLCVNYSFTDYIPDRINLHTVTVVFVFFLISVLIMQGVVFGYALNENKQISEAQPVSALEDTTEGEGNVVVLGSQEYRATVLYSEGQTRPIIFVATDRVKQVITYRTNLAVVRVIKPEEITEQNVQYLFLRNACNPLNDREQAYLNVTLDAGGEVLYRNEQRRGAGCVTRTVVATVPEQ